LSRGDRSRQAQERTPEERERARQERERRRAERTGQAYTEPPAAGELDDHDPALPEPQPEPKPGPEHEPEPEPELPAQPVAAIEPAAVAEPGPEEPTPDPALEPLAPPGIDQAPSAEPAPAEPAAAEAAAVEPVAVEPAAAEPAPAEPAPAEPAGAEPDPGQAPVIEPVPSEHPPEPPTEEHPVVEPPVVEAEHAGAHVSPDGKHAQPEVEAMPEIDPEQSAPELASEPSGFEAATHEHEPTVAEADPAAAAAASEAELAASQLAAAEFAAAEVAAAELEAAGGLAGAPVPEVHSRLPPPPPKIGRARSRRRDRAGQSVNPTLPARRGRRPAVSRLGAVIALAAAIAAVIILLSSLSGSKHPKATSTATIVKVVIPEGETRVQIAAIAAKDGLRGSYRVASRHSPLLDPTHYGAPANTPDLEGFLFPATYDEYPGALATRLVADQLVAFKESFGANLIARAHALHITPYQMLIVASMVEREAQVPGDRAKIAAVIYNRLSREMPLGIDATIYYAVELEKGVATYTHELTEAQLHIDSPYNTRTHLGLPPTPISNPGLASIEAAANPAHASYLYYVAGADGCGEQVFSTTLAAFEANDAAYQAAVKKNGGHPPTCKKK